MKRILLGTLIVFVAALCEAKTTKTPQNSEAKKIYREHQWMAKTIQNWSKRHVFVASKIKNPKDRVKFSKLNRDDAMKGIKAEAFMNLLVVRDTSHVMTFQTISAKPFKYQMTDHKLKSRKTALMEILFPVAHADGDTQWGFLYEQLHALYTNCAVSGGDCPGFDMSEDQFNLQASGLVADLQMSDISCIADSSSRFRDHAYATDVAGHRLIINCPSMKECDVSQTMDLSNQTIPDAASRDLSRQRLAEQARSDLAAQGITLNPDNLQFTADGHIVINDTLNTSLRSLSGSQISALKKYVLPDSSRSDLDVYNTFQAADRDDVSILDYQEMVDSYLPVVRAIAACCGDANCRGSYFDATQHDMVPDRTAQ